MKRIVFVLACLLSGGFLSADLDDFKQNVESAENKEKEEEAEAEAEKEKARNAAVVSDETDDSDDNFFVTIIFGLFRYVWIMNNTLTTYGEHPYGSDGYIRWARTEYPEYGGDPVSIPVSGRDQWYRADVQGIWMKGIGYGTWVSFESHLFRFFGPYLENWTVMDGKSILNGLRLGATFSLFQSDPFSLSAYGQWTLWSGVLERNGGTFGFEIDSFPVRPVAIRLRGGFQLFPSFSLGELELQAGCLFDRFELFAGRRFWNLFAVDGSSTYFSDGFFTGVRVYF